MKKKNILYLFTLVIIFGFIKKSGDEVYFTIPKNWPKPIYNFSKNPLSNNKIVLGSALFYDPILSKDNTVSCASCHSHRRGFAHNDHVLSHGIGDQIGFRNAPGIVNLAWSKNFMWDGAIHHLDSQALAPITNTMEMGENMDNVILKLKSSKLYPKLFLKSYGDSIITGERTLKAISQFTLTLVSSNSKYDKVIRKEDEEKFSESEKNGYQLFKNNCAVCHKEPLFTNNSFENNGLKPDNILMDIGRMKITQNKKDSLLFKVPTLRNIAVTYPYMHDGRYSDLKSVLSHYTDNIHHSKTLSKELLKPIVLSEKEKNDIIDFLNTLTDDEFLRNEKHSYPRDLLLPYLIH
jgi:cytochrome c peroxidase